MDPAVAGALIVAFGSLLANIGQFINYRQQNIKLLAEAKSIQHIDRKSDAETVDILTEASGQLVANYRLDLEDARKQICELKAQFVLVNEDISRLKLENIELKKVRDDYDLLIQENEELWKGLIISLGQLSDSDIVPKWKPNPTILKKYSEYIPRNRAKSKLI